MSIRAEVMTAIKVYLVLWVLVVIVLVIVLSSIMESFLDAMHQLGELLTNGSFLMAFQLCFVGVYLIFILSRYIVRGYRKQGVRIALKRFSLFLFLPVLGGYLSFKGIVSSNSKEAYEYVWNRAVENTEAVPKRLFLEDGKHRGMSVFRLGGSDHPASMKALVKDHVEWVAVIPFLYQENEQTKTLRSRAVFEGWSRRDSVLIKNIESFHKQGMYVHLKPHVWLGDGWRSNIQLADEDWDAWFTTYQKEMVHYAKIAQHTDVGLFCIGTELRSVIAHRPNAWKGLIAAVKEKYDGKLTYAANWDDPIDKIPFWQEMDYIGIQAYFPLTDHKYPEINAIKEGWDAHLPLLEQASAQYHKPVLFTEVGYRSDASATVKPWEWGNRLGILYTKKSDRTQQYAYEALFESLWDKPWFAGSYIWQWHTTTTPEDMIDDVDFTPRFKPAENTIARWYGTVGEPTMEID